MGYFEAKKSVQEFIQSPNLYSHNNIDGLLKLIRFAENIRISKIVSISICTVYGKSLQISDNESEATNNSDTPYGNTKRWTEEILHEFARLNYSMRVVILGYFNPVDAHRSGLIGELPRGIPSNLIHYIYQTAVGLRNHLRIYGYDYSTVHGTAIRDYIHVSDVAAAHLSALEYAKRMF